MTAPPPIADSEESPYALYATTLTFMLEPRTKLNGEAVRALKGILHAVLTVIVESEPSQLLSS